MLWVVRRRVGPLFFATAFGMALLCLPGSVAANIIERRAHTCQPHWFGACVSTAAFATFANGVLGTLCALVLLILTGLVALERALIRYERRMRTDPETSETPAR